jgi:small-conductance mechanosensitive channel
VVPANLEAFFATCSGVAGALIGLLFVAVSVSADRLAKAEAANQASRIRANAALVAFTNALSVSLFALLPGEKVGYTAAIVAFIGILFIAGALLSLVRMWHKRSRVRDGIFLIGLVVVFTVQLISGIQVVQRPAFADGVETIAILVISCFIIGISRAWELIGGPSIGFHQEVFRMVRSERAEQPAEGAAGSSGEGSAAGEDAPPEDRQRPEA